MHSVDQESIVRSVKQGGIYSPDWVNKPAIEHS